MVRWTVRISPSDGMAALYGKAREGLRDHVWSWCVHGRVGRMEKPGRYNVTGHPCPNPFFPLPGIRSGQGSGSLSAQSKIATEPNEPLRHFDQNSPAMNEDRSRSALTVRQIGRAHV